MYARPGPTLLLKRSFCVHFRLTMCETDIQMELAFEALAADLMRALRGKRSQRAFSRRLGMKSNTAYNWEAGRRWPTGARTLWIAQRVGIDPPPSCRPCCSVIPMPSGSGSSARG